MKRIASIVLIMLAFLGAGILAQACQGSAATAPIAQPGAASGSPSATSAPLWIMDNGSLNSNRLVALDAQSG